MTYELNNIEIKEKMRKSKEESKEAPKRQIALKSTIEEETINNDMSDEEFDDLVLLVKKWRGSRNNRKFQWKDDKGEERSKEIICYECDKPGHKRIECRTKRRISRKMY